jgi:hypothetical protein
MVLSYNLMVASTLKRNLEMSLIKPGSLAATVHAFDDAMWSGRSVSKSEKIAGAKWIAGRCGLEGSYEGMPTPTMKDFAGGVRLFTGEKVSSRAGVSHILGQEACRMLIVLGVNLPKVKASLRMANEGISARVYSVDNSHLKRGMYCCAVCSCAMWRHLAVGGLKEQSLLLNRAVKTLRSRRDGKGRWRGFPFYYTLLALSEMNVADAGKEIVYARGACERSLARLKGRDRIAKRRELLLEKLLNGYS